MATFGMQLVSRIITTGCLPEVIEWGITANDFVDPNANAMFTMVYGYNKQAEAAGSVLGQNSLQGMFPQFTACDDVHMTVAGLCNMARKERIIQDARNSTVKLYETLDTDPVKALSEHQANVQALIALGDNKNQDVFFSSMIDNIICDYDMAEQGIKRSILQWPWDALNEESGGLQEDDYIIFYGRPKSKKSFVLAYLIAYLFSSGARGLIYTKEMTPKSILQRIAAFYAGIPYGALRKGKLSDTQKKTLYYLRDYAKQIENSNRLICLSGKDAPNNGMGDTPSWLRSKVAKYKPQYLAIDSLYLMNSDNKHKQLNERVQEISRCVRQIGLDFGIPVIATLQANRAAAKHKNAELDEIAFSDAIGQDATAAFRVMAEKHTDPESTPTILLGVAGSREWQLDGFRIYGDPCVDFGYHSNITVKDLLNAQEQDGEDAKQDKKRKPSGVGAKLTNEQNEQLRKHLKKLQKS